MRYVRNKANGKIITGPEDFDKLKEGEMRRSHFDMAQDIGGATSAGFCAVSPILRNVQVWGRSHSLDLGRDEDDAEALKQHFAQLEADK